MQAFRLSIPRIPTWLKPDWRTIAAAVLIVLAFPPWGFTPLIWVALVPWFWALDERTLRNPEPRDAPACAIQGVWLSFFMTLGGFYWVASVLHEFGELPWGVSVLGLLIFSFIGQPQFFLFAPIRQSFRKTLAPLSVRPVLSLGIGLSLALAYSGLDWILPKLFVDTLGHAFYTTRSIRQVADLGGATLLTFLVYLTNETLWLWIQTLKTPRGSLAWKKAWQIHRLSLAATSVLIVAAYLYGERRYEQIEAILKSPHPTVQMGVIQANIGDFDKIASERGIYAAGRKVLGTFFGMSENALKLDPKPELVIWPETSYPSTFKTPQNPDEAARDRSMEGFVQSHDVPLLFGGYDHANGKDYNAFFFLSPKTVASVSPSHGPQGATELGNTSETSLQTYRKSILLLFGEYIPGADQFRFLRDAFPQVGNFGRGAGPEVFKIPLKRKDLADVKVGPVICYEALFPDFVLAAARKGSQLILNITNDSWFGPSGEPELHLALITFRSIESRLPQLRATNTGISALILPDGEITQSTDVFKAEILNASVPILPPIPTLMLAWGDWFGLTSLLLGFSLLGLGGWIVRKGAPTLSTR